MEKNIVSINTGNGQSMQIEILPGVNQVRSCKHFNPLDHLTLISFKEGETPHLYLEVVWRVQWFHTWLDENGYRGRIEENLCSQIGNYIQTEAKVYIGDELAGVGIGGISLVGNDMPYAIQQAATIAKGRALANAGFGGIYASALASESGADVTPCDSGVRSQDFFRPINLNEPDPSEADVPFRVGKNTESAPKATQKKRSSQTVKQAAVQPTAYSEVKQDPKSNINFSFEQARDFMISIPGNKHYGKTLGVACTEDPKFLRYLLSQSRFPNLQAAAKAYEAGSNFDNW